MKILYSLTLVTAFGSSLCFAQTDPGVTPGRVTPTTPTAPAAATAEKTAPADATAEKNTKSAELKRGAAFAKATLEAKSGSKAAGTVSFAQEGAGIKVTGNFTGVTPGKHGFHIHEKGDCSAADASTAGGHFNPTSTSHGGPTAKTRHAGDLGNIDIKSDGTGSVTIKLASPKDFNAWTDIAGKAVILHEKADELKTQPTGDAVGRIACGVIELTPRTAH